MDLPAGVRVVGRDELLTQVIGEVFAAGRLVSARASAGAHARTAQTRLASLSGRTSQPQSWLRAPTSSRPRPFSSVAAAGRLMGTPSPGARLSQTSSRNQVRSDSNRSHSTGSLPRML